MATIQDLGLVTAYGYAKAGGYSGTEAQFETFMANLPTYATNAASSATAAAQSASAAAGSVTQTTKIYNDTVTVYNNTVREAAAAGQAEDNAEGYASTAAQSMAQAATHAASASASALAAETSKDYAHDSETNAAQAETRAAGHATAAQASALTAETAVDNSQKAATLSESWAVGGTGQRPGENSNNAKYWCQQAQAVVGIGVFHGATATTNGTDGLVPGPGAGSQWDVLFGDGTWKAQNHVFVGTSTEWGNEPNKDMYKVVVLTDQ